MTIIEPQKNKRHLNIFLMSSMMLSLGAIFWSVLAYNASINLARDLRAVEAKHKAVLTANVDLKNKVYGLLDTKNLRKLAESEGLVQVSHPEYFEIKESVVLAER